MSYLAIATQHDDVILDRIPEGWAARCPRCEWTSTPQPTISAAMRRATIHSDEETAAGLEDPPRTLMPDPRYPWPA